MNKFFFFGVFSTLAFSTLYASDNSSSDMRRDDSVRETIDSFRKLDEKEVSEVDKVKKMFKKGKVSGQLRIMHAGAAQKGDAYASAIGGIIKYELAEYRGFNAGAAVYTSHDINSLSGEGVKRSTELSGAEGSYTEMGEAFLNYKYGDLNFRAGRQLLDTPLADGDDVRVIQNSFEAYVGTYDLNGFELIAGNIQRWQGSGADLDVGWVKTGSNGTNFTGISYFDGIELDAYYYNITELTNAAYLDVGIEYKLTDDILLHGMMQYLNESELNNSGVSATIYGALAEVVVYGLGVNIAVNKAQKHSGKSSFSGFGGGALFTNMDTMILDEIAIDRDAFSYVLGVTYSYKEFEFLYAYGDFNGNEDSMSDKAQIVEQNLGIGYNFNEEFTVGAHYVIQEDKINLSNDWQRLQASLNYNF